VQTNLLKLMEETEVPARSPNDISGQIQAMMDMSQRGKKSPANINTKHILFIVSGAFDGLEKIVKKRLREASIGFAAPPPGSVEDASALEHSQTRDFIEFGFEPEFIGRLPVRVICQPLTVDDLFTILKTSEGSIIRQYEQTFAAYGIEVLFRDDGLRRIAELAGEESTGARGLMTGLRARVPRFQIRAAFDAGAALRRHARTGGQSCRGIAEVAGRAPKGGAGGGAAIGA
jgi:ATP-dependent Clp protease ATP-binding subunit ClpX